MTYHNPDVNRYLLDIPLEALVSRIVKNIDDSDGKIEKQRLKRYLIEQVTLLRQSIPPEEYPELTMPEAHAVVQELLYQNFLAFSEDNPNPKAELYFEPTQKAREIRI